MESSNVNFNAINQLSFLWNDRWIYSVDGLCFWWTTLMHYFEDGFAQIDFKQKEHFTKVKVKFSLILWERKGGFSRVKGKNRNNLQKYDINFHKNTPWMSGKCRIKEKSKWVYSKVHSSLLCCVKLGPFSHNKKVYALMVISYWVKSLGQPEKSQFGVLCVWWKILLELIFSSFLSFWLS